MNKIIKILTALAMLFAIVQSKQTFLGEQQKKLDKQNIGDEFPGQYTVKSCDYNSDQYSWEGQIEYEGPLDTFMAENNPVIKKLNYRIRQDTNQEVSFKFWPTDSPYFDLPSEAPFPFEKKSDQQGYFGYDVRTPVVGQPLSFALYNNLNDSVVWESTERFVFSQLYCQVGTHVYGEEIWGWGERRGQWGYKEDGQYTIWNYDNPVNSSYGEVAQQTYGTHPMWLLRTNKNKQGKKIGTNYSIMYLRTAYGLEMDYQRNNNIGIQMSGGPVELKFFVYDNLKDNIRAYHKYVNGWQLHPFWSMGFQLCRWGLPTSTEWADMYEKAVENKISFDVIWSDIDYMQDYEDFTISKTYNIETMKSVTDLKNPLGVRWMPIIDAGVGYIGDSGLTGNEKDLFIKSAETEESLIGCVWPGAAYFVDFNHPEAKQFWINGLKNITKVYDGPQPSGIWLDMNDPSSFTDSAGEVTDPKECVSPVSPRASKSSWKQKAKNFVSRMFKKINKVLSPKKSQNNDWGYPWSPMGDLPLQYKTISTSGIHYNQKDAAYVHAENFQITEYEFHNLYAFLQGLATNEYLKQSGFDLPFIITRSTFAGSGAFSQHWTGDNYAAWDQLEASLGDIFNFQLFGIPMTSGDICGFAGETNAELCARWYQLGSWYPFMRSHNANDAPDQFPWSFPQDPYVLESSRNAINLRYSFMKWYYAIFVRTQPYGGVFNPLFFEYPDDEMAQNEAHQALIGHEVMITPVLSEGDAQSKITPLKIYFPGEKRVQWYDFFSDKVYSGGDIVDLSIPFDAQVPMFIKEGSILHQQPQYMKEGVQTRAREMNNEFRLVITLDSNSQAKGNILGLEDDYDGSVGKLCVGENNCVLNIEANLFTTVGNKKEIQIQIIPSNAKTQYPGTITITSIQILGVANIENVNYEYNSKQTSYIIVVPT